MTYLDQVRALQLLKGEGLVRRIGLSNVTEAELDLAISELGSASDGGVVSVQNELSPRYRADLDVLARCEREGIAFLPWSPLGGATHAKDVGSRFAAFADVADDARGNPARGDAGVAAAHVPGDDSHPGGDPPGNRHVDRALDDA